MLNHFVWIAIFPIFYHWSRHTHRHKHTYTGIHTDTHILMYTHIVPD